MQLIKSAQAAKIGENVGLLLQTTPGNIAWNNYVKVLAEAFFFATAVAAFIYLVMGAFNVLSASGNAANIELGKKRMTWAVIGLLIVAGSFLIWKLALEVIGLKNIDTVGL